ncbi:MAG: HWE histidine kinase domain-containing protein [Pseudomonadota bacterium]
MQEAHEGQVSDRAAVARQSSLPKRPGRRGSDALLIAAIILPLVFLAGSAWVAWRDAWRSAERELASDADAVSEYALRVFDGHRLAGEFANHLLRGLSDDAIRAQAAELHRELNGLLQSMPGLLTIVVLDREGMVLLNAALYPIPPGSQVADREWVQALRAPNPPALHISGLTTGRLSPTLFFALSMRRTGSGNGLPEGAFDGVVTVSINPAQLSAGLGSVSGAGASTASLVRTDGVLMARSSGVTDSLSQLPADSPLRIAAREGTTRGTYIGRALGVASANAGEARLIAFRRVGTLPVYATAGRPKPEIVARWREVASLQMAVGLPAWLAFIGLAWMFRRGQRALADANAQLEQRVEERTAALRLGEAQLRVAQLAARIGTWVLDPESGEFSWSDEQYALFGMSQARDGMMTYERFLTEVVHPDDRPQLEAIAAAAFASGEFDADFRAWRRLPDGQRQVFWVSGRGRRVPGPDGRERMFGINVDISERKESERRQQLLMHEVDHRAKNVLAVVQAALRLTPRDDPHAYARSVEGRVAALARAHILLAERRWSGASLRDLVQGEVGALDPGADAAAMPRIEIQGPEVMLAPAAAQALSMALHELATNAAQHGALSDASGRLDASWRVDAQAGTLELRWVEGGGPPIQQPPDRPGFGSRIVEAAVRDQLGGQLKRQWLRDGLVLVITLPLAALALAA